MSNEVMSNLERIAQLRQQLEKLPEEEEKVLDFNELFPDSDDENLIENVETNEILVETPKETRNSKESETDSPSENDEEYVPSPEKPIKAKFKRSSPHSKSTKKQRESDKKQLLSKTQKVLRESNVTLTAKTTEKTPTPQNAQNRRKVSSFLTLLNKRSQSIGVNIVKQAIEKAETAKVSIETTEIVTKSVEETVLVETEKESVVFDDEEGVLGVEHVVSNEEDIEEAFLKDFGATQAEQKDEVTAHKPKPTEKNISTYFTAAEVTESVETAVSEEDVESEDESIEAIEETEKAEDREAVEETEEVEEVKESEQGEDVTREDVTENEAPRKRKLLKPRRKEISSDSEEETLPREYAEKPEATNAFIDEEAEESDADQTIDPSNSRVEDYFDPLNEIEKLDNVLEELNDFVVENSDGEEDVPYSAAARTWEDEEDMETIRMFTEKFVKKYEFPEEEAEDPQETRKTTLTSEIREKMLQAERAAFEMGVRNDAPGDEEEAILKTQRRLVAALEKRRKVNNTANEIPNEILNLKSSKPTESVEEVADGKKPKNDFYTKLAKKSGSFLHKSDEEKERLVRCVRDSVANGTSFSNKSSWVFERKDIRNGGKTASPLMSPEKKLKKSKLFSSLKTFNFKQ